LTTTGTTALV